ncbi:hypothetical protein, partial [Nitrosomonas communis]|uniref:hypothetical protein n=1 Tax=Nitrosomonas communis TaxID=44574 RepID=UPI003D2981B8
MTRKNIQQLPNDGKQQSYSAYALESVSLSKPLIEEHINGHLDKCEASGIHGWACNKNDPSNPLEIEVLADGLLIGRSVANLFREDLLALGVGYGNHGFKIEPPAALFDGKQHLIEAQEVSTGHMLPNSPMIFKAVLFKSNDIRLDGGSLIGSVWLPEGCATPLYLKVMEDGTIIGDGWCTPDNDIANKANFRVSLPVSVFDGRPHSFSVRCNDPAMSLGEIALITPYMLTPESALLHYAREGLKPSLATMSGFRYESLINTISQFAEETNSSVLENSTGANGKKTAQNSEARQRLVEKLSQIAHAHAQMVRGFSEKDKIFKPLVFPSIENPCVSIVIPVHNKFPVTYHCLLSLLLAPNRAS